MRRGSQQHMFSHVPQAQIPRASFKRDFTHKTTFNSGYLIPIFLDEALPGDTFRVNMNCFARLSTPIVPLMDNMRLDAFFFFVPNRLLWSNWQRFMGEQDNPDDSTDYVIPKLEDSSVFTAETIGDYFGLPVGKTLVNVSALPFRAYNLIWNEWFRDENLQDSTVVAKNDGPDSITVYSLKRRGKRHDYFTSCLPWPQKGDGVELPLGSTAPVIPANAGAFPTFWIGETGQGQAGGLYVPVNGTGGQGNPVNFPQTGWPNTSGPDSRLLWGDDSTPFGTGLVADLNAATSATINSLRQAFQIQKLMERDARGGTRYTEILRSHFGVISPDARLQRPEFLGGGSVPVNINPVAQTSGSPPDLTTGGYTDSPQGNLAAFGTVAGGGIGFSKSFVEHGYILGLIAVRAELSYQQGLNKLWSRKSKYDFYWPALSHLGEQAVLNKEIYYQGNTGEDEAVFGYQERWAEYRYKPSQITGQFRSSYAQTLDYWHLAQNFLTKPVLGDTFIQDNPPIDRTVAVPSEPQFLFDSYFAMQCARPMPIYSVPGLIDHF